MYDASFEMVVSVKGTLKCINYSVLVFTTDKY